ncbi:helix-turn-helix transcriptional regulator [Paenibacillus peoriae]|uniref:helix-turn-helix domain-containing protein n=1 Tax=Paenibacillus peoriae TaxID=59893 RepID=UPI00026C5F35|nr:helix-turn-helix transcriptional regulator [Paenibacillus peoriae]MEC0180661.1 helix-turn-helix transcriptional regulator [Paenibacillus peoriae]
MDNNEWILYCKLGEIIEKHDVSALKLSEDIDHRRTTITDLIHNKDMVNKRIPASLITKLCVYFDVTPNDLFEIRKRVE